MLTLVMSESANDAALSTGLNVGDPVDSLAISITSVTTKATTILVVSFRRLMSLYGEN